MKYCRYLPVVNTVYRDLCFACITSHSPDRFSTGDVRGLRKMYWHDPVPANDTP
jgi:hypothetical protein